MGVVGDSRVDPCRPLAWTLCGMGLIDLFAESKDSKRANSKKALPYLEESYSLADPQVRNRMEPGDGTILLYELALSNSLLKRGEKAAVIQFFKLGERRLSQSFDRHAGLFANGNQMAIQTQILPGAVVPRPVLLHAGLDEVAPDRGLLGIDFDRAA